MKTARQIITVLALLMPFISFQSPCFGSPTAERSQRSAEDITTLDLQKMIDDAVKQGQKKLVIPPGSYRVQKRIVLSKLEDFTLEGAGVTLVFPPEEVGFQLNGCSRVTIRGITIDCDPLPFTQATITKVTEEGTRLEFEVHAGYPALPPDRNPQSFLFDPQTLRWKLESPDLNHQTFEVLDPTRGRVTMARQADTPGLRDIQVGDFLAFKGTTPVSNAFGMVGCDDVRFEDVTILTALVGFIARCCTGPVTLQRCVITRGPKPPGAVHERLLSTIADGFNLAYSRQGVVMEDCDFSFMGDDAVNLHGCFVGVAAVEDGGKTVWVARTGNTEFMQTIRPGDNLRILEASSFAVKSEANIVTCDVPAPPAELKAQIMEDWKLPPETKLFLVRFRLDQPVAAAAGDSIEVPAIAGPGFVFRNNYFHDHRARGLRLGASDGIIENNRFERIKGPAITLGPHIEAGRWHEGGWVRDVTVRNNTLRDLCFTDRVFSAHSVSAGAIVVQASWHHRAEPYAPENRNIRILDNTIDTIGGAGVLVTSADGVDIRGNRIAKTQMRDCDHIKLPTRAAVSINNSQSVVVEDNTFGQAGTYSGATVEENP